MYDLGNAVAHLPALGREQVYYVRVLPGGQAFPAGAGKHCVQFFPQSHARFFDEGIFTNAEGAGKQGLDRYQQYIAHEQQSHLQGIAQRHEPIRQPVVANLQHVQQGNEHDDTDAAENGHPDIPQQDREKGLSVAFPDGLKQRFHAGLIPPANSDL